MHFLDNLNNERMKNVIFKFLKCLFKLALKLFKKKYVIFYHHLEI